MLLVRGRTLDNAENLSDVFLRTIRAKYEGTTLGRQELDGLLLADAEGAVVTTDLIDRTRVRPEHVPELLRVVVACDPAVTSRATSDHTGIVVVGLGDRPLPGHLGTVARTGGLHAYLLADESLRSTPRDWAARLLKVAEQWAADAVVGEVNNGGDLIETMVTLVAEADGLPVPRFIPVRAAVNKRTRAEPVAGMWEQARVHVVDALPDVEDQFAGWATGDPKSPDQFDAAVWGVVSHFPELAIGSPTQVRILSGGGRR